MSRHRGRHPADARLFAADSLAVLRRAVDELSWLLSRDYGHTAALELVGNRHGLRQRQRKAVLRAACSDSARCSRAARKREPGDLSGCELWVDGFNCIITLESAMAGGVVLIGRDRAHRDLSSVHGSYRRVDETRAGVAAVAALCCDSDMAAVRWFLDRPVSNSGRLKALIHDAAPAGLPWQVELAYSPDKELIVPGDHVVASSDSWVLDHCQSWVDIPGAIIARAVDSAWLVDLGQSDAISDMNR